MSGYICSDCRNHFVQPPRCMSCGAQKLYDNTVRSQAKEIERQAEQIEKMQEVLRPFAAVLQGHYHHQVNEMQIVAGHHKDDLRFKLTLGDFREARAALGVSTRMTRRWEKRND